MGWWPAGNNIPWMGMDSKGNFNKKRMVCFLNVEEPLYKNNKVLKGSQAMYKSHLVFIRLMSFVY